MNTEMSQVELHKDECTCRGCGVKGNVMVAPELKVNKWLCKNCGLIQLWVPSKAYRAVTDSQERNTVEALRGRQRTLFCAGPFVGVGVDGCLTGVHEDPSHVQMILLVAFGLAVVRIIVAYYRQEREEKKSYWKVQQRQKASNRVSGVDDWNRQRPIVSLSAMSKARSLAKD